MTADIETRDPEKVSDLLGDCVYISWCDATGAYGEANTNLSGWLMRVFLVVEKAEQILYIHNGFRFDLKRMDWGDIARAGFTVHFLNDKDLNIKGMTFHRAGFTWIIRDSYLILPYSLDKVTRTFSPDEVKIKREKSFDEVPFNEHDPGDQAYAIQDSRALYAAIENANRLMLSTFNVQIHDGVTAPSLSFRAFRQSLGAWDEFPSVLGDAAHAAKESYRGGQTLALSTIPHEDEVSIDCNSMYGWCMINFPLPTGETKKYAGIPKKGYDPERTLCLAAVYIPQGVFPFLKTQSVKRVGNFRGHLLGWWWGFELDFQASLGAEVEVLESFVWQETTTVMRDYISTCRDLRYQDYFGAVGELAKLMTNSSYGKLAQEAPDQHIILTADPPEDALPLYDPTSESLVNYLYSIKEEKKARINLTHWASHITAHARLRLAETMRAVGFANCDYCDTDSIFFEARYMERVRDYLGDQYGQYKVEKEFDIFQAVAPKAYKGILKNKKTLVKNKGIPSHLLLKQGGYDKVGIGGEVTYIQSNNLMQMLKKRKGYGQAASRKVATEKSTTNGRMVEGRWQPSTCEVRKLYEVRGKNAPFYISSKYARIVLENKKKEEAYTLAKANTCGYGDTPIHTGQASG